ncbi:cytochrome P450 94C1-like [Mangifera indica]|uniref:cytochrome P450 94C1-like n=1 Tax=Mangifera indica TaxID=29780 RepID=UPI001CFB1012|nr:cytochrome P450 94C1-like [Mangifera indica]
MGSDFDSSLWLQSLCTTFCFIFFTFTTSFSLFSFLLYLFLKLKPWCQCDTCRSFLTTSWSKDFANLCDWYTYLLEKSPTGTIHLHALGNIITANPENVEHILKTRFDNYPKGKPFSVILGDLLGRGIFNVDGDSWKLQRKMASFELGGVSIRHYALDLVMSEIQSKLIPLLSSVSDKEKVLDLQDVFRRFSFDNICRFSFGLDPECLQLSMPSSEFAEAFDLASKISAERGLASSPFIWKMKRLLNIGTERKLKEALKLVNELSEKMINERRKLGLSNKNDLLSRFMGSIHDEKFLRDIVVSFLLAGRDTVASGLTSFFFLLSQHPEVEADIRSESDRVIDPKQDSISYEKIQNMHYLNAAVHESLRLFPPVQFDSKFAQDDDVLPDGTFVRKGSRVTYHPYAMGRMERIWGANCLEFKPERWLKNGKFVPENPYKYPVFQAGHRVCLGKEMALVEMRSVVIAVVRRFKVRVVEPNQAPLFAPGLTATVKGGLPVMVEQRRD